MHDPIELAAALLVPALALGCGAPPAPAAAPATQAPTAAQTERPPPTRTFHIRYQALLEGLPVGEAVRLWIPIPSGDSHQVISNLTVEGPWPARTTREARHGNRLLYVEATAEEETAQVTVAYDVARWERTSDLEALRGDGHDDAAAYARALQPSRRVVVDARLRQIAARLAADRPDALGKGRAFYEQVLEAMTYDKSGEGWGRGDSVFACEVGRGNCTDFHAYFMALCLAEGIPSRFQIGLYGDYEVRPGEEYETGGYHCWAEFRVPGKAWVPVDISEADKHPARAEYFFGNHTANRVTLSTGRDLVLEPAQAGPPLNYMVQPYAEVNGRPFAGVSKRATWRDAE